MVRQWPSCDVSDASMIHTFGYINIQQDPDDCRSCWEMDSSDSEHEPIDAMRISDACMPQCAHADRLLSNVSSWTG